MATCFIMTVMLHREPFLRNDRNQRTSENARNSTEYTQKLEPWSAKTSRTKTRASA